jgi:SAM-dependent methyltransferase
MTEYSYVGDELDLFRHATQWKRYYASKLKPFIKGQVLEVGAGIGGTAPFLCSERTQTWTCLEPDHRLLEALTHRLTGEPFGVPVSARAGTLDNLARDEGFDTLLYIDVLEHIEDDRAELEKAASHLNPGGTLIVLAPAHNWLFSEFDRAIGHFRRYDRRSLLRVQPPGVKLVRAFYLDAVGMLASLTNRLFMRASKPTPQQIRFWNDWMIPASVTLDPLAAYTIGKTVIAIWERPLV